MSEQQDEKIGALWSKASGRGEFFTGNIELKPEHVKAMIASGEAKIQIVVFRNDKKTGNQPDWRILKARPKGETAPPPTAPVTDITDQDVPF